MKPLVSVIIPNYNYEKFIAQTIESVLSQTHKELEILVIDDESKDNSIEVLESFGDKITVIRQKNAGVSAARNNGIQKSNGEFIAFLDADDLWKPAKIEKQLEKFEEDETIGLVHCSVELIDLNNEVIGENREGMEGDVAEEFLKFQKGVVIGAGSTGLVRRKVFDEIGGFDLRLSTAADWDFSYRLATKYKIGFVREPLVQYRLHGTNMHGNIGVMEHDMLIGFEKAFENGAKVDKSKCYSNLHLTLSGSYFYAKQYTQFAKHLLKSIYLNPLNFGYFIKYPLRKIRKN